MCMRERGDINYYQPAQRVLIKCLVQNKEMYVYDNDIVLELCFSYMFNWMEIPGEIERILEKVLGNTKERQRNHSTINCIIDVKAIKYQIKKTSKIQKYLEYERICRILKNNHIFINTKVKC